MRETVSQLVLQGLALRVNRHSFFQMAHMTTQFTTHPGRAVPVLPHRDIRTDRAAALAIAPARRQRGARSRTRCFVATLDDFNSTGPSAVGLLTQAASLVAVAAGAWYAARLASQQVSADGKLSLTWLQPPLLRICRKLASINQQRSAKSVLLVSAAISDVEAPEGVL